MIDRFSSGGRFPSGWLDELRGRADIVAIVGEHVSLTHKGRKSWGLCPFHGEKTPSFSVDGEKQMYYCFGCKAGGTAIKFLQEQERLSFPEAVKYLAERVNLPLPQMQRGEDEASLTLKQRLAEANRSAAQFYHQQLWQPDAKDLLDYLYRRGLDDAVIRKFGIGATGPGWDALTRHLMGQGFALDELVKAGLSVQREGRTYDMFRQRAIFPIISATGQVVGFGGRAMGDAQPKYLNTSDTPVFNKRLGLYALNLLRKIRKLSRILLVEGYMDVVALTQYGVQGAVATLGTSLTPEQARLIRRYGPVWICYDGDSAGQNATLRALDICEQENVQAHVLVIPDKLDPDEFIRARGLEAFEQLEPLSGVSYRLVRAQEKVDMSTQEGRTQYAMDAADILRQIEQPVELETHIRRLAVETGFPREVLLAQIGHTAAQKLTQRPIAPRPGPRLGQQEPLSEAGHAEKTLIGLLGAGLIDSQVVALEDFERPTYQALARSLLEGMSPQAILEQQTDDALRAETAELFNLTVELAEQSPLAIAADCLGKIRLARVKARIGALNQSLASLTGDMRIDAMEQIKSLMIERRRLESGRKDGSV